MHFNKCHPRLSKICKSCAHLNQFLLLLYDCVPNVSQFLSISKLLKNPNVLQLKIGKNPTTALYKETRKRVFSYDKTKTIKK